MLPEERHCFWPPVRERHDLHLASRSLLFALGLQGQGPSFFGEGTGLRGDETQSSPPGASMSAGLDDEARFFFLFLPVSMKQGATRPGFLFFPASMEASWRRATRPCICFPASIGAPPPSCSCLVATSVLLLLLRRNAADAPGGGGHGHGVLRFALALATPRAQSARCGEALFNYFLRPGTRLQSCHFTRKVQNSH
jgi:hypothetical protein